MQVAIVMAIVLKQFTRENVMINDEISNEMVDILLKLDRNLAPSIYDTVPLFLSFSLVWY